MQQAQRSTPAGFVRPGLVFLCALLAATPAVAQPNHKGEVCLGVHFGGGNYDNPDFNKDLVRIGYDPIDSGIEYGFSLDYRFSKWLSINGSASRIGGEAVPPDSPGSLPGEGVTFTVTGSPLVFGVVAHPWGNRHLNVDVFAGGGPMLNTTISQATGGFEIEAQQVGVYYHGGVTGEYRFSPMVAISLSALARHAEASNIDFTQMTGDPTAHWDVSFTGTAFWFGPRLYFGTSEE
jgi:hypothetical protein